MNTAFPFITPFFDWLLRTSWQSAILICLVLLAQAVFRKQLTPRWRYVLWLVVVIRLALPLPPQSGLSLFNLLQPAAPTESFVTGRPSFRPSMVQNRVPRIKFTRLDEQAPVVISPLRYRQPSPKPLQFSQALPILWAAGALCLLARVIFEERRLRRDLRFANAITEPAILELLESVKAQTKVRRRVTLLETNQVPGPALYGFMRPRLLLPLGLAEKFSRQELQHIFLHELAHVKRGDIAMNWLLAALQIVHWFNPLVWFAFHRLRADREVACDAHALGLAGLAERQSYGATIIKLLEDFNPRAAVIPALVGILEDKHQIKRRISMIANFKLSSRWSLLAGLLVGIIGIVGLTEAQPRKATPEAQQSASEFKPIASKDPKPQEASAHNDLLILVLDASNNQPLVDSALKVTCCDSNHCLLLGRFAMPAFGPVSVRYPAGASSLAVHVSREGYVPKLITWRPGRNDLIDGQYIAKLERGSTIGGLVKDEDGKPVPGVKVLLDGPGVEDPLAREHLGMQGHSFFVTTDDDGKWVTHSAPTNLAPISFRLEHPDFVETGHAHDGSAASYADRSKLIPEKALREQTALLVLRRGRTLAGIVTDSTGKPVPQASVLLGEKFTQNPRRQTTDESGRFRFKNVSHERTVTVQAAGYAPNIRFLDPEKQPAEVNLQLGKGLSIKGQVVDESGNAIEGATVTAGTALWRGVQTLDWDATTDREGYFTWDSAPEDNIVLTIFKSGYTVVEAPTLGGSPGRVTTLRKEFSFSGSVVDADTRNPIEEFRVTPGEPFEFGPGNRQSNWQPFLAVRGRNGKFNLKPDRPVSQILKIEAEGYLPLVSETLAVENAGKPLIFELRRGSGPKGVVQLPDGQPAAEAEVTLKSNGNYVELGRRKFNRSGGEQDSRIVKTDSAGRFALPPEAEATALIAVHPRGFAEIPFGGFVSSKPVVLQPWGRIEGVLNIGGRLGTNQLVTLSASSSHDPGSFQLEFDGFQRRTDDQGRFSIESAPPGQRALVRLIPQGNRSWRHSYASPLEVKPGGTTTVSMGGSGCAIIGKAILAAANTPPDWSSGHHSLRTPHPTPPSSLKAPEEFRKWSELPEVKAQLANSRNYPVVFSEDGSFRVDEVPAGKYILDLNLREGGGLGPPSGRPIAALQHDVTVPEMPNGRRDEPLDLGTLELKPPTQSAQRR